VVREVVLAAAAFNVEARVLGNSLEQGALARPVLSDEEGDVGGYVNVDAAREGGNVEGVAFGSTFSANVTMRRRKGPRSPLDVRLEDTRYSRSRIFALFQVIRSPAGSSRITTLVAA
jgi:hypothetical protein